jgi:hypothetical protein
MRKTLVITALWLVGSLALPREAGAQVLEETRIEPPASTDSDIPAGAVLLRLRFIDRSTLLPTAVRVGVFDSTSSPVPPSPAGKYLFQDVGAGSYFYANGIAEVVLPAGPVTIRVQKGFEYEPVAIQKMFLHDTYLTIGLRRWIDTRNLGWFSGETHTHMTHGPIVYTLTPADLMLVMEAEDLHFLNSMDQVDQFIGGPHPLSSRGRALYFSREYRNPVFGHISLLGLSTWVSTEEGCWDTADVACGRILDSEVAAAVHAQPGAMLIMTHPFPTRDYFDISPWPGGGVARGIPLDLVDGNIDAIDILCYTHLRPPEGLEEYTQALNAGFRIPASAGTDANLSSASSYPPGGYRVYAKLGDGPGDFDPMAWIDAVKKGKSFVTNFPIFEAFEIEGQQVGSIVPVGEATVAGYVRVRCAAPMEKVEIVTENGTVAVVQPPPGGDGRFISGTFSLQTDSNRWVVARATGRHASWHVVSAAGLFAQTNPIYLDNLNPSGPLVHPAQRQAADYFINRLSQLTSLFATRGFYPAEAKPAFDAALQRALVYYHGMAPDPPAGFALLEPMTWSYELGGTVAPTTSPTFRWETAIDRDPGGYVRYRLRYGPDSTFATGCDSVTVTDTLYTVPGESALSNLQRYYWSVTAIDETGLKTEATPPMASFTVDITASSTGDASAPPDWRLGPAAPNPFNPRIRVEYTVPPGAGLHSIEVIDVRGVVVRTLYSGTRTAGRYEVVWDGASDRGRRVASGVYFLRLSSVNRGTIDTQKILMLK